MTGPAAPARTEMWFEERTRAVIYLQPVTGGGQGWYVQFVTDREPPRSDYLRQTYHGDLLWAMERIVWLMDNIAPGTWARVLDTIPAVTIQPYAEQNTTKGAPS